MSTETRGEIEKNQYYFNLERDLKEVGAIDSSHTVTSVSRIFDSGMRSESWMYGYEINTLDSEGNSSTSHILERNVLSTGGHLTERAQRFVKRVRTFEELGIPTPHTYGVVKASIYQEFIHNERASQRLREMEKEEPGNELDQLVQMAVILDRNGYTNPSLGDLYYDPSRHLFLYGDVGIDLNDPNPDLPGNTSFRTSLTMRFSKHKEYIHRKYSEIREASENAQRLAS